MKLLRILGIFCFCFLGGKFVLGQQQDSLLLKSTQSNLKKIEKAVRNNDNTSLAASYVSLSDENYNQGNYAKSEEYLLKAKSIYESLKDKKNLKTVLRKLALSQEKQNKDKEAVISYEKAAGYSTDDYSNKINSNDAKRLKSSNLETKEFAIQQNIQMNVAKNSQEELAQNYTQLAEVQIQQQNIKSAEKNLTKAYDLAKVTVPQQALQINQKLTDALVKSNHFDKAIEVKKKVLKEDFVQKDEKEKVKQYQELADIYLKKNSDEEAEKLLTNSYKIAVQKGYTLEAKSSIQKLDSLYLKSGNTSKSIDLYRNFLHQLPQMISKDQSLMNTKILEETEARISQLENEKKLQDELIQKQNNFTYVLIASTLILSIFVLLILFTLKKVKTKNKKIALQSLRREMNPHFIFNSLNSVNQFIASNNELEANQYLTKFSRLMRGVMENSKDDFIPFNQELELLQNYLALEKTRFSEKFDYQIEIDETLPTQNLMIPGMLVQPFLENAIWHGLRYRENKGFLELKFIRENNQINIQITDNGIGIEESKKQKTEHQKQREGRGMKNTLERISLLNDLYKKNIHCKISDSSQGVKVEIKFDL